MLDKQNAPRERSFTIVQDRHTGREISRQLRLRRKKSRKQSTFSGTYIPPRSGRSNQTRESLASFFYPDYDCRPRSSTGSCFLECRSLLLYFQQQAVGLHRLVGYTTDRELHPAPKVFIWLVKLYPCGHKMQNSCPRACYNAITL
jgi:hypothetical protein